MRVRGRVRPLARQERIVIRPHDVPTGCILPIYGASAHKETNKALFRRLDRIHEAGQFAHYVSSGYVSLLSGHAAHPPPPPQSAAMDLPHKHFHHHSLCSRHSTRACSPPPPRPASPAYRRTTVVHQQHCASGPCKCHLDYILHNQRSVHVFAKEHVGVLNPNAHPTHKPSLILSILAQYVMQGECTSHSVAFSMLVACFERNNNDRIGPCLSVYCFSAGLFW